MVSKRHTDIVRTLELVLRDIGGDIRRAQGKTDHTIKTHAYDLLTHYDVQVEERLKAVLAEVDPGTPVFGEESGGDTSSSRYWMIDPIDGTIHFVRGMPFFTSMIVLIVDEKPVVSVIYNFMTDEFFWAIKGEGAYRGQEPLVVSARPVDHAIALLEIGHKDTTNNAFFSSLASKCKIMELVCAGYEFLLVATGKVEARIIYDPFGKPFDFAPGALLVQEAGGVVRNFNGDDYTVTDVNFIAAASEELYERFRTIHQESKEK